MKALRYLYEVTRKHMVASAMVILVVNSPKLRSHTPEELTSEPPNSPHLPHQAGRFFVSGAKLVAADYVGATLVVARLQRTGV
jgi:hypothetical protein